MACFRSFQTLLPGVLCALVALPLSAQRALTSADGRIRLLPTDEAVFESGVAKQDLPCEVVPLRTVLGFDMRFHSGYELRVPLRELAGTESLLTIMFRVHPDGHPEQPLYFSQRVRVPELSEEAKGDAYLQGAFDSGEGKFHVDWLVRDRHERVCSSSWDVSAELPSRDKEMELIIPRETVLAAATHDFHEEQPVVRSAGEAPLNVKVLVNFAPQRSRASSLQPIDTSALVSILRTIAREPRVGKFTVVAFNLREQRVVYRQDSADRIDFPALGQAVETINPGVVDLKLLAQKHGETAFLSDLIQQETKDSAPTDALIFAGPKALLDEQVPEETLREIGELPYPVFYMNYNLSPQAVPWRDAIGNAVKQLKGKEFTITRPRDLWFAVTEMVGQISKLKHDRRASVSQTE